MENKIKFRNKDTNNNPILVILIGLILTAAAIGLYILTNGKELDNAKLILAVEIILAVLGVYFILFGIFRAILLYRVKKLLSDPNAKVVDAKFTKERYSSINGSDTEYNGIPLTGKAYVFKKVFYEYTDDTGVTRKAKSVLSYTPNQVRYLKEKQSFQIKCKGKLSVIIEEMPDTELALKFNAFKGEFETPCVKKKDAKGE